MNASHCNNMKQNTLNHILGAGATRDMDTVRAVM